MFASGAATAVTVGWQQTASAAPLAPEQAGNITVDFKQGAGEQGHQRARRPQRNNPTGAISKVARDQYSRSEISYTVPAGTAVSIDVS
jgi:hypothetical protein